MNEMFETRLMELMLEHSSEQPANDCPWGDNTSIIHVIEPWEAIECVRKMLNEFEATIYQP